jgi:hypothetical protein
MIFRLKFPYIIEPMRKMNVFSGNNILKVVGGGITPLM